MGTVWAQVGGQDSGRGEARLLTSGKRKRQGIKVKCTLLKEQICYLSQGLP